MSQPGTPNMLKNLRSGMPAARVVDLPKRA
jgi:hypothetical protein